MKKQWKGERVDLDALIKRVEEFYRNQGVKTTTEHKQDTYFVYATKVFEKKPLGFLVSVRGSSDDFSVEFSSNRGRGVALISPLISMIGGGIFILDKLKVEGFYDVIESDFWAFVKEAVERSRIS